MKILKPRLSLEQVEEFFSVDFGLSEKSKKSLPRYTDAALWYLDQGKARVWNVAKGDVNLWAKRAILAYFSSHSSKRAKSGAFEYCDKLPVKNLKGAAGVRIVPGAVVRFGAYLEPGTIVMPGFVNVGAYVETGTMVDAWATVGSCAQIGKNVHLSGGVGIGGVLEPAQAAPVIIEDGVFIGSRCIVVEGVRVRKEAVLGAGVVITASTKIIDVRGHVAVEIKGEVPERAIVIPGTTQKEFAAGSFGVPCALIIGTRSESTDKKTSLNSALRDHQVAV